MSVFETIYNDYRGGRTRPSQPQTQNQKKSGSVFETIYNDYKSGKKPSPKPQPVEVIGDVKKLPDFLGGGEFRGSSTLKPKELESYKSKREDLKPSTVEEIRGGTFKETEKEVDHKISLALGGTNNKENLQALKNKKSLYQVVSDLITGKERDANEYAVRQEGKVDIEQKAIDKYMSGEISLAEARAAIVDWKNPEPFLHEKEKVGKYFLPELKKKAENVGDFLMPPVAFVKNFFKSKDAPTTPAMQVAKGGKDAKATPVLPTEVQSVSNFYTGDAKTTPPGLGIAYSVISPIVAQVGTTLRNAKNQFESGPTGKIESLKGAFKGLAEATIELGKFASGAAQTFNPISYLPQYKEAREKQYKFIDAQVEKITPEKGYEDVFSVGKFIGDAVPYVASDMAITKAFTTLPKALQTSKIAQEIAEATSWIGVGQILHNEKEDMSRVNQGLLDSAMYFGFRVLGLSGLGLKKIVEDGIKSETMAALKSKLTPDAAQILTKMESGEKVLLQEVEFLNNEIKAIELPGEEMVKELKTTTNKINELENFIQNSRDVEYRIDPEAENVKITFPKTEAEGKITRIVAPSSEDLLKVSKTYGQKLPVAVQREVFDLFSGLSGQAINIDDIISGLTANAVKKGYMNPKAITDEITRLVSKIEDEVNLLNKKEGRFDYKNIVDRALKNDKSVRTLAPDLYDFIQTSAKLEGVKVPEPKLKPTPKAEVEKMGVEAPKESKIKPKETEPVEASAKKQKQVSVSRDIMPVGNGEKKVSRLEARMRGVLDEVSKLTDEQIDELGLTRYKVMNIPKQLADADEFVKNNPNDIIPILSGQKEAPKGLLPESIYVAASKIATGDMELTRKLASLRATRAGQSLRILSELDPNSPIKYLDELKRVKEEIQAGKEDIKLVIKKEVNKVKNEIKKAAPKKAEWESFIESIKC